MESPGSESERLLYRVLQRANLLPYYDTFVQQGGDDVTQLCEAGEEEFLEIMALVGMAAKPLHVRRLQKTLQEYVSNPALFLHPLGSTTPPPPAARGSIVSVVGRPVVSGGPTYGPTAHVQEQKAIVIAPTSGSPSWAGPGTDSHSCSPIPAHIEHESAFSDSPAPIWKAPGLTNGSAPSPGALDMSTGSVSPTPSNGTGNGLDAGGIPTLTEAQRQSIEVAAEGLVQDLPVYDMKPLNMKREYNRELMQVITMPDDHPEKMTLLRKYAAIYGRFDSKRKNEGKMTLHEVSVNEAAAQLCRRIPALLTRRDDLYPLSRRVVRDSGYQYSKGHSRACSSIDIIINNKRAQAAADGSPSKKPKTDVTAPPPQQQQGDFDLESGPAERVHEIHSELSALVSRQEALKARMTAARADSEWALLDSLRGQLEQLAAQQLQLRMEQSQIIGSSKTKSKSPGSSSARTVKAVNGSVATSRKVATGTPAASRPAGTPGASQPAGTPATSHPAATGSSTVQPQKISLVEEGLRIAQQYGLADFADELKIFGGDDSDSELDEQAEWNREVERDMIQQRLVPPASTERQDT